MKNFLILQLSIAILLFLVQSGIAQKLTIIDQNYEQAKIESQNQNKLLLIDFYTTWCSPCKEIERKIFEDEKVSSEMSKSFVVLRYDAEKDEEFQLSLKHHIRSYPTTIVLNKNQFVVSKLYGFGGEDKDLVENYQKFLAESIDKDSRNEFIKGVSNSTKDIVYPKFYQDYVYRINTETDEKAINEFWENNTDYLSELSFQILTYFYGTEKVNSFFLENHQKYMELYGKTDVDYVKSIISMNYFSKALAAKDRKQFDAAVQFMRTIFADFDKQQTERSIESWEQNMLMAENRWSEALKFYLARQKRYNFDNGYTNNFCYDVYRKSSDKNVIKQCANIMKKVTDKEPTYEYLDTYALLLYKSDNLKLAKTTFEKAIKVGKLAKEDTKSSEKWLKAVQEKINQKNTKKRS